MIGISKAYGFFLRIATLVKFLKGLIRLHITDSTLLHELEHLTETSGVSTLSTRKLAELTGISRKTVIRSLGRLAAGGHITKTKSAVGIHSTHWKATNVKSARTTPVGNKAVSAGTADAFRRRDLQGPGALYRELPDVGSFTAEQVLENTQLTTRLRTLEWWLLILGSQRWPLVEELSDASGKVCWTKNHLEEWQLQDNADHLSDLAVASGRPSIRPRRGMELQHQLERANPSRMFPFSVAVAA